MMAKRLGVRRAGICDSHKNNKDTTNRSACGRRRAHRAQRANRTCTTRGLVILVARLTGREHKRIFSLCHYFAIMEPAQRMNPDTWEETNGRIERQKRASRQHECLQVWACGYSEAAHQRSTESRRAGLRTDIFRARKRKTVKGKPHRIKNTHPVVLTHPRFSEPW